MSLIYKCRLENVIVKAINRMEEKRISNTYLFFQVTPGYDVYYEFRLVHARKPLVWTVWDNETKYMFHLDVNALSFIDAATNIINTRHTYVTKVMIHCNRKGVDISIFTEDN